MEFIWYHYLGSKVTLKNIMNLSLSQCEFVGLAYQGKDIVFRFIIEYSSLMDFGP
jgi:hypothetical protein